MEKTPHSSLKKIGRTSLFFRMCLLFGLLVTLTLLISGLLLSYTGWRTVRESGREAARAGRQMLKKSVADVSERAEQTMTEAASEVAAVGQKELEGTLNEARTAGQESLQATTESARTSSRKVLSDATSQMGDVGEKALRKSLTQVGAANRGALDDMRRHFNTQMSEQIDGASEDIRRPLRDELLAFWQSTSERRAQAVQERLRRAATELVIRLEAPLRSAAIVHRDEEQAPQVLRGKLFTSAGPSLARAMLVSSNGQEWARWPESDLMAGQDPPDWSDSPLRKRLFSLAEDGAEPSYVVDGVRADESGKGWVYRLAHRIVTTSEPRPMVDDEPAVISPGPFIVVDIKLDTLVEQSSIDGPPDGMEVLALHAASARVVSSRYPDEVDQLARRLTDLLPKVGEAAQYAEKPYRLSFEQDGVKKELLARYWGETDGVWTVITQSESTILEPLEELASGIGAIWSKSLEHVVDESKALIAQREQSADGVRSRLQKAAQQEMDRKQDALLATVNRELTADGQRQSAKLERQLQQKMDEIRRGAGDRMVAATSGVAAETAEDVRQAAAVEINRSGPRMEEESRRIAARAAGRMFVQSALMIPLFLLLALLLAALTARSLVKPINQLVVGTQAIAAGDYDQRIEVRGADELARLALAFNNMAGAVQTGQDELRQSHDSLATEKARIEAMLQASPDGLVMFEPDGRVAYLNPTACALLSLDRADLPPAPFAISELPGAAAERLPATLAAARAAEGVGVHEWAEPERCVVQCMEVELPGRGGAAPGRLLHLHDITRERIIDEMKSDFISLVSHELRTPLTSILGFSSYLLTEKLGKVGEGQKPALESIHRQARRLAAIISDFLDISRIESGRIEMKKQPVCMVRVAERVVQDLQPQATERNIRVTTHAEDSEEALVALGDEQRIAQIFINLVGNALKFTEQEGAIDVSLARQNGVVVCRVRDTGCGIPPDELDRVFDRFYQVEKVVIRKTGGTGLGLAIVKNIVEAHDGRISISSQVGEGTEVSFSLPAMEESEHAAA